MENMYHRKLVLAAIRAQIIADLQIIDGVWHLCFWAS